MDAHAMSHRLTREALAEQMRLFGLRTGDVVLIRASLKPVGRLEGGAATFLQALLDVVEPEGTVVSLAFTAASFLKPARKSQPFTPTTRTNAGALPQAMLDHPRSFRSTHPTCSFVAIGRQAEEIIEGHGPHAGAYEPVRRAMTLRGKGLLVGCVKSSPGFTTAHVAEHDLGLHRRVIAPWLTSIYY